MTKAKRSLKFESDLMVGGHMWCRFKGKKGKEKKKQKRRVTLCLVGQILGGMENIGRKT